MKRRIVVSGVNLVELGPLSVFQDALASLAREYADKYEIVALVHRASLFDVPGVTFREYPEIKPSWLARLRFEYSTCRAISRELKPHLWLAMHDMTPKVEAEIQAVYCHNPSPFYSFRWKEALQEWKFGLFVLFYRFLYGINIKANDYVIVQQQWLRREFETRYNVKRVVVAHPGMAKLPETVRVEPREAEHARYSFFYPAFPRTFKNLEQILEAARELETQGFDEFEGWITTDGTENAYAKGLRERFQDLTTVQWLGVLPRDRVFELYKQADCLLFPSKLETWGMPITEFQETGKPILAVDLPYAHETVGTYPQASFFQMDNPNELALQMQRAAQGMPLFHAVTTADPTAPFSRNWSELWHILLGKGGEPR